MDIWSALQEASVPRDKKIGKKLAATLYPLWGFPVYMIIWFFISMMIGVSVAFAAILIPQWLYGDLSQTTRRYLIGFGLLVPMAVSWPPFLWSLFSLRPKVRRLAQDGIMTLGVVIPPTRFSISVFLANVLGGGAYTSHSNVIIEHEGRTYTYSIKAGSGSLPTEGQTVGVLFLKDSKRAVVFADHPCEATCISTSNESFSEQQR